MRRGHYKGEVRERGFIGTFEIVPANKAAAHSPGELAGRVLRGVRPNAHAMPHALLLLGRQLAGTLVEHRSLAPSPPWAGRDGEGRSGSKGGEGPARGGGLCRVWRDANAVLHVLLLGRWVVS